MDDEKFLLLLMLIDNCAKMTTLYGAATNSGFTKSERRQFRSEWKQLEMKRKMYMDRALEMTSGHRKDTDTSRV